MELKYMDNKINVFSDLLRISKDLEDINLQLTQIMQDLNQREINVKTPPYNLKGDGSDETGSVQSLFNLANSEGSVHLYFPKGVYGISDIIRVYKNTYVEWHPEAVFLRIGGTSHNKFFLNGEMGNWSSAPGYTGEGNIHFRGGIFDMNVENYPLASLSHSTGYINFGHGENFSFKDMTFRNGQAGHVFQLASLKNVLIQNCKFKNIPQTDPDYFNSEAVQIEIATSTSFPYFGSGEGNVPSKNITIENCEFENVVRAIGGHGYPWNEDNTEPIRCENIYIINNTITNTISAGIMPFAYKNVFIRGNILKDIGGYGVSGRYVENMHISENYMENIFSSGIYTDKSEDIFIHKEYHKNTCTRNLTEMSLYSSIRLDEIDHADIDKYVLRGTTHNYGIYCSNSVNIIIKDEIIEQGLGTLVGGDSSSVSNTLVGVRKALGT
jgi:hypothetical protein